ncbi:MAG: nitrogen fixation protein NifX [Synechococcales bacterium]|nr:nitrogen fixation protein NifX [Synechococcales bacterium]
MKIAFATTDQVHINAHFGWAKAINIYEVNQDGYEFDKTLKFTGDLKEDGNEDKLVPKIKALEGCTIVYVAAIGGSAAARIIQKGVTPIKANSEDDVITEVLDRFVQLLNGSPPPWLRKALQNTAKSFEDDLTDVEEEVLV